jgi:hypothetical protein
MKDVRPRSKTTSVAFALAILAFGRPAAGQQCPVAEVGQPCNGGAGSCVQSMCTIYDAGVPLGQPCAFCEPVACPIAEVGQACEGGTCTQATCTGSDDAGQGARQTCAVCASPQANACSPAQVGQTCSNGGVCTMMDTRALGPAGSPPPAELYYPITVCVVAPVTPDGGALDVDAAAGHALSSNDAAAPSDAQAGLSTASSGGTGCDLSGGAGGLSSWGPLLLLGGLVAAAHRRWGRVGAAGARP